MPIVINGIYQCGEMKKLHVARVLIVSLLTALASCDDKPGAGQSLTAPKQLENLLREQSEASGFLWLDKKLTMLDLESAMERSHSLPMSPRQAMEAVRAYVQAHPEEGEKRACNPEPKHARVSVIGHYYFFRSMRNIKFSAPRLVGFFVDARNGEVIPYPGEGFSGAESDSPYQVVIPYHEDSVGKILLSPDDPKALWFLGWAYQKGAVVPKSPQKAAQCLKRAADGGYSMAQHDYAECCRQGSGVPASQDEAIRYYRMAVEHQYPDAAAARKLGHCYARGEGVPQSWEQAAHWYGVASKAEDAEGSYCLADCYEKGQGVPPSREKAIEHYHALVTDRRTAVDNERKAWADKASAALRRLEDKR